MKIRQEKWFALMFVVIAYVNHETVEGVSFEAKMKKVFLRALFLNLAIVKISTRKVQEFWYSQRTVNVTFAALLFSSSISFLFSFNDINLQLNFHDFLRFSISSVSVFIFKSWQSRAFRYWSFNFSYFSASARRFSDSAVSWSFIEWRLSNFPCKVA